MLETLLIFFVISSGVYWTPQILLTTSGSEHLTELKARRKSAIHRVFFAFQIAYLAVTIWAASGIDASPEKRFAISLVALIPIGILSVIQLFNITRRE